MNDNETSCRCEAIEKPDVLFKIYHDYLNNWMAEMLALLIDRCRPLLTGGCYE